MKTHWFSITTKDLVLQTFRAGGKGGQKQNKSDSGVRFIHPPSGARGEARDQRSQLANKRSALKRLVEDPKFKIWINRVRFAEDEIEKAVDRSTDSKYLRIEVKDARGRWQIVDKVQQLV